ncbi:MAG: hypothetical protein IJR31_06260, partial [Lachnospiraceae bacterium]|nr:hypothetical protein [Lachnospiraceae bacterium]
YIHTNPVDQSFGILKKVCEKLEQGLYVVSGMQETENGVSVEDSATVDRYIEEKVLKNIKLIEENHRLSELLRYEEVVINGRRVKGFPELKRQMSRDRLKEIFAADVITPIHGDVTVENIVTVPVSDRYPDGYYLIDPNTVNILDSRFIDIAKILQSLHGGYEFLMRTDRCRVSGNEIQFMSGMSRAYRDLYREYRAYLESRYDEKAMRSIRYHEMVNWLRLMPYKLEKNPQTAAVFLAGLLLTAEDII